MTSTLFDQPGLARASDPGTSHTAARAGRWGSHRRNLLTAFAEHGSLSYEQAGEHVGLDNVRATRRCSELANDCLITFDGTYGLTSTGSDCRKFVITPGGRDALAADRRGAK